MRKSDTFSQISRILVEFLSNFCPIWSNFGRFVSNLVEFLSKFCRFKSGSKTGEQHPRINVLETLKSQSKFLYRKYAQN